MKLTFEISRPGQHEPRNIGLVSRNKHLDSKLSYLADIVVTFLHTQLREPQYRLPPSPMPMRSNYVTVELCYVAFGYTMNHTSWVDQLKICGGPRDCSLEEYRRGIHYHP